MKLEVSYFNRWVGFPEAVIHWQHAGVITGTLLLGGRTHSVAATHH